ncbi:protein kinase domain-containing protein [Neobacillus dielmonensis]|uniref:protein kinase domain-containing protein n=1 Tax=Neobacillus dielmonensis TaxID=1347369 RepID=UPI0005A67128|nr:serine/threonine protein kinase [Neobacillus dielmonensis]
MMNHSLKSRYKVQPGTAVVGKWHNNQYTILKELGYGANGVVYLVKYGSRHAALKMSDNSMSITSEVNVLKSFAKVQGTSLGPSLLDVDDWQTGGTKVSFYVMEYIQGPDLLSFLLQKGKSWMPVVFLQLLNDLAQLHDNGWVFGDLKPENLIVTGPPPAVRCIDVGGTTIQGRAIKEFTEFYDRGYWGLGSRKAEPTYDLFACAMIMINTAYPNRFTKQTGGMAQLKAAIKQKQELLPYEKLILRALEGYYPSAKQMRDDLLEIVTNQTVAAQPKPSGGGSFQQSGNKSSTQYTQGNQKKKQTNVAKQPLSRQTYRKKKKKSSWKEFFIIAAILGALYGGYIFMKLL